MRGQRNGAIDLMRFILTLAVVVVHLISAYLGDSVTILRGGSIAVEFFFILSGLLLAASADRADHSLPVWEATWRMMKGKVCGLYPMWILTLILRFIAEIIVKRLSPAESLRMVEESVTGFLMLTQLGLKDSAAVITYSWYIPVMLLCTLMLYPLLFTRRTAFTYSVAPLAVLFCATHLYGSTGSLFTRTEWLGFTWSATLRGLFGMCLGVICYDFSLKLKTRLAHRLTRAGRTMFTLLEAAVLLYAFYYVLRFLYPEILLNVTLCFAVFITLSFSGVSRSAEIFRSPLWPRLGQYSLAVYLAQSFPAVTLVNVYGRMERLPFILLYLGMTFAVSLFLWYGGKGLTTLFRRGKDLFRRACLTPEP